MANEIVLVDYDKAMELLAKARNVPEVKDIHDKAIGWQRYAKAAKNKQGEADAWEIRVTSTRRLGEMMANGKDDRRAHGVSRVGNGPSKPTLMQAGIDKHLADIGRKLFTLTAKEFKLFVIDGRADVQRTVERTTLSALRRRQRHRSIAAAAKLLLENVGPFPLIYADPPWQWGNFGEIGKQNEKGLGRSPDQHYPTLKYEEIKAFEVAGKTVSNIAHKDAALFLWCTSANLPYALEVMVAWGFEYKTHAVWVKDKSGLGLVFRNKHEVLLYGTRGRMPGPQYQPPSVFSFPRGRHSAKPPEIRTELEKMYPDFDAKTRLELFARGKAEGWSSYGLEA